VARSKQSIERPVVAVAYSAGRDSTALLHATARAGRTQGFDVVALHVHHGLMPQADAWLGFAQSQCQKWRKAGLPVRLVSTRLTGKPAKSDSIEAWARRERRAALARMAREAGAGAILLAQHRRDQAETVLLQALRGAGAAGLAAMPRALEHEGLLWLRPWLHQPREAIDAYLRRYRLRYVDDASNADPRFSRSRLRVVLWPALTAAFADAEGALMAVAQRAHEAQQVLAEVAEGDLADVAADAQLDVARWRALSAARRANALRAWLQCTLHRGAPETLVQRLLGELPQASHARWPVDGTQQLALYRGRLSLARPAKVKAADAPGTIDLSRAGTHALPQWGGAFEVTPAPQGLPPGVLRACTLRQRSGGERFQRAPRSTPRSLKKQYQAAGIAAWQRDGPLVYVDGKLLFAPGLGIDARWLAVGAAAGTPGLTLQWRAAGDEPCAGRGAAAKIIGSATRGRSPPARRRSDARRLTGLHQPWH
jgi:tRNA(Ile)-lysidine synthase